MLEAKDRTSPLGADSCFCAPVHGLSVVCTYLVQSSEVLKNAKSEALARSACGLAVFCSLLVLVRNYRYPKHDFVGARNFVDAARKPEDAVATIGLATYAFSKYYAPSRQVGDGAVFVYRSRPAHQKHPV